MFECCICHNLLPGNGNNPDGAVWKNEKGEIEFPKFENWERCCDKCDHAYVIPGRMYRLALERRKGTNNA